jgi:DNA-binding phage protein
MRILEVDDVISLLRSEVERAGTQEAWGKKNGIDRTAINKTLKGERSPSTAILKALRLRVAFVSEKKTPRRRP